MTVVRETPTPEYHCRERRDTAYSQPQVFYIACALVPVQSQAQLQSLAVHLLLQIPQSTHEWFVFSLAWLFPQDGEIALPIGYIGRRNKFCSVIEKWCGLVS